MYRFYTIIMYNKINNENLTNFNNEKKLFKKKLLYLAYFISI